MIPKKTCIFRGFGPAVNHHSVAASQQRFSFTSSGERQTNRKLEMWANAQRDDRPVEYRWRPLFNAAVWLCSNAAKTRNPLKFAGVPQTNETISAASGPTSPYCNDVGEILLLNKFFSDCRYVP